MTTEGESKSKDKNPEIFAKIDDLNVARSVKQKIKDIASNTGQSIRFEDVYIGIDGFTLIGQALENNIRLTELVFINVVILDGGAIILGRNNATLTELTFGNNNIGPRCAAAIAEGLLRSATSIKSILIINNPIGDEGVAFITEALSHHSLAQLVFVETSIGDIGAIAIANFISKSTTIQSVFINNNHIGDSGVKAIADATLECATLKNLFLGENDVGSYGYLYLAKLSRKNKYLEILDVSTIDYKTFQDRSTKQIKILGKGAFGMVGLVEHDGVTMVEKCCENDKSKMEESFERLILSAIPKHKNIVEVLGLSEQYRLLLKAHRGGSVLEYSKNNTDSISILKLLNLSLQMSEAVEHIHKCGVVHRDLAQRNYVLTEDYETPVLIDYGLAWPLQSDDFVGIQEDELMPYKQCPPEVLNVLNYYKTSDVWELGLTFWQFLCGRPPFAVYGPAELKSLLNRKMVQEGGKIPLSFNHSRRDPAFIRVLKEIVYFCCAYDYVKRPSASDVVMKIKLLMENVTRESKVVQQADEDEKDVAEYIVDEEAIDEALKAYGGTDYQLLGGRYVYLHTVAIVPEHKKEPADELNVLDAQLEPHGGVVDDGSSVSAAAEDTGAAGDAGADSDVASDAGDVSYCGARADGDVVSGAGNVVTGDKDQGYELQFDKLGDAPNQYDKL